MNDTHPVEPGIDQRYDIPASVFEPLDRTGLEAFATAALCIAADANEAWRSCGSRRCRKRKRCQAMRAKLRGKRCHARIDDAMAHSFALLTAFAFGLYDVSAADDEP